MPSESVAQQRYDCALDLPEVSIVHPNCLKGFSYPRHPRNRQLEFFTAKGAEERRAKCKKRARIEILYLRVPLRPPR